MARFDCFDWDSGGDRRPFDADSPGDAAKAFAEDQDNAARNWGERFVGVIDEQGTVTVWRVEAEIEIVYKAEEA